MPGEVNGVLEKLGWRNKVRRGKKDDYPKKFWFGKRKLKPTKDTLKNEQNRTGKHFLEATELAV